MFGMLAVLRAISEKSPFPEAQRRGITYTAPNDTKYETRRCLRSSSASETHGWSVHHRQLLKVPRKKKKNHTLQRPTKTVQHVHKLGEENINHN